MPFGTFLNGGSITQLRGLPFLALSGSGYVSSTSGTSDAGGGRTAATTSGGTIPCRIESIRKNEEQVADRIVDVSTHLITLPPGTPITHQDTFHSLDEVATYEVTAVRNATAEWVRTVEAVKLD